MISVYMRRGRQWLRRWSRSPGLHRTARLGAHFLAGFCLSAASLGQGALTLASGLVWSCQGWDALLAAAGSSLGYRCLWGPAADQGQVWIATALLGALLLGQRRISRELPLLLPALGMLTVSAAGLGFQLFLADATPVWLYLLRVALGGAAPWLFCRRTESPVARWLCWGLLTLGLAQIAPVSWLSFGYVAAGIAAMAGAFPCAAAVGLALDLSGITPVPMAAVTVLGYFLRFLPSGGYLCLGPAVMGTVLMFLSGRWDVRILPGLLIGSILGRFLPGTGKQIRQRGETGSAQVRLELAAGVLERARELLEDVSLGAVDTDALVSRAVETACMGCSRRRSCRDTERVRRFTGALLQKPLRGIEELPFCCQKPGEILKELHRSQEKLRDILGQRQRQQEYRLAAQQLYGSLAVWLQSLSDGLAHRRTPAQYRYTPAVRIWGNCPPGSSGDRCVHFYGSGVRYYIILCDGMGTGTGAALEGDSVSQLLRQMLCAGFPAEQALGSLNSLLTLGERAGAATVDLAEISLDTGKVTLYKWGAGPSFLVENGGVRILGSVGMPPGLDVKARTQSLCSGVLHREALLLLVSDGISEETVLGCCRNGDCLTPEAAGRTILEQAAADIEDDATVVTVRLLPVK